MAVLPAGARFASDVSALPASGAPMGARSPRQGGDGLAARVRFARPDALFT